MQAEEIGRWIFAISKHLKSFVAENAAMALLYATRRSAQDGELLLRIRGYGSVQYQQLEALALDIGIPVQELPTTITRLESTNLITVLQINNKIISIRETILTEQEVYRATAYLFENTNPSEAERALLPCIELLSQLPLTETELVERICKLGFTEENVRRSLELQHAFGLTQNQQVNDMGIALLYNEYLWGHKIEKIGTVIARLGGREKDYLLSLMEEVRQSQGQSLENLSAAPKHIIALAAQKGILDTTTIITSANREKTFVFSPNFYGYRTKGIPTTIIDPADQVRLFVASMMYGTLYSEDFRLHSPLAFVRKLAHEGEAGNATPILRDYILLEKQGIVNVKTTKPGFGTFILRKKDVVIQALDVLENGSLQNLDRTSEDARFLAQQNSFRSPEANRLRGAFAQPVGDTRQLSHDLIASIREEAQKANW
jgi:hypothetical protein